MHQSLLSFFALDPVYHHLHALRTWPSMDDLQQAGVSEAGTAVSDHR